MQNKNETRSLNGLTTISASNVKSSHKMEVGGILVHTKTTATCSAATSANLTIKSSFVEAHPFSGLTSEVDNIYLDDSFGDTIPDGTLIRITAISTATHIRFTEAGNIDLDTPSPNPWKDVNSRTFLNFVWVEAQGKWVWASGHGCCIC